jgi:predicted methyltransferase
MRRRTILAATALAATLSCEKKDAPPPIPPDGPAATTPTTEVEESGPAEKTETAKKPAQPTQEELMVKRLAEMEAEAAKTRERWTPELEKKVAALNGKKWTSTKTALKTILASEHRAPGNAERDAFRHPSETLVFMGLEPNMKVFEVAQGAGWYTEILAPLLAHDGKLYLAGYDAESSDPGQAFSAKAMDLFISAHGNLFEKVELVQQEPKGTPNLGAPDSLDMVIVFRMLHNFHRAKMWDDVMPTIHAVLKPGGVLAIEQHRAPEGANADESANKGYMPEKWVIEKIEGYGFELDKKSEINANAKDTKDYAEGVWTLPPSLALGDKDRDKYTAIGESDRMTLRFVKIKPKAAKPAATTAKAELAAEKTEKAPEPKGKAPADKVKAPK